MTEPEDLERQKETWEQKVGRHSVTAETKYKIFMTRLEESKPGRAWSSQHPALRWALSIAFVALLALIVGLFLI